MSQLTTRAWSDDAVGLELMMLLKSLDRVEGLGPEFAVDRTW